MILEIQLQWTVFGDNVGICRNEAIYLVLIFYLVCLAMVLGHYVIKGIGNIQDTFGGGQVWPAAIAGFGILFSIIRTMVVKITDDQQRSANSAFKYRGTGFQ
jgi:K(+)-stimulated pyrophosphate-energized sodium pump